MRHTRRPIILTAVPLITMLCASSAIAERSVSFNRDIQPILSEYCYHCHGPDSATRKPKSEPLRLDGEAHAFAVREDGKPAIVKGKPEESSIISRILTTDKDEVMPPPESLKTLKPEEIALLKQWIAEGARYEMHWSYLAPVKPPVPVTEGQGLTEIDHLVNAKLKEAGLSMNPPEDNARAFRRLCFDLTGLPPQPEALAAFLADAAPDSWEKAVDRLMDTDACAEHFARHWLDAVRYGDTHGIHIDNFRSIWPYRDWVIAAFRKNMPFDQFTIEQMAGDLLPAATVQQQVATGYNRCMPTTGEGGAIGEEYDAIYAKDRVDTMSAVWLGVTTGCATCHDHKFDPLTMRDFYSLTAFFRNSPMSALDGNNAEHPPVLNVPSPQDEARVKVLPAEIEAAKKAVESRRKSARGDFDKWLAGAASAPLQEPAADKLALHLPLSEASGPSRGTAGGKPAEWPDAKERRDGVAGPAPVANGQAVSGDVAQFARSGQASFGLMMRMEGKSNGAILSRMDAARAFRGWDLFLVDGRPAVHIIDHWQDKAIKVVAKKALTEGAWHHVMAVFDGSKKGAAAITIYVNGAPQKLTAEADGEFADISVDAPIRIGARSSGANGLDSLVTGKVAVQDVRLYQSALTTPEVKQLANAVPVRQFLALPEDKRTPKLREEMFERWTASYDEEGYKLQAALDALTEELQTVKSRGTATLVMQEKSEEPFAYVLSRGDYRNKTDKVGTATPAVLPPMDAAQPKNRLGLAKWLVAKENPLTARVTANRVWSYLFGTGIVETTEDVGVSGARPVNQELLDWLAVSFMESGWDYRALVKRMVVSQAYRQAATVTKEKLEKDPLNRLISRGPRYRLDAEQIRDGALAASGLLVAKVGGPPVKPYQPEGVWEAVAMKESNTRFYKQDSGENLYRRSMYTLWKRTAPPASMDILNAPSRESFCTRRERTNTPLQAFVTMNDPQFVEASRQLAALAMASSADRNTRLDFVTERLISRRFNETERKVTLRTLDRALAAYQADAAAAQSLIAVGESKAPASLPPAELAAWTLAVSQILNMDESLTK